MKPLVSVIESYSDLQALEPEWLDLWSRCRTSTPFQSPDWLMPWLRWRGCNLKIQTITVRVHGRLVAVLPAGLDDSTGTVRFFGYGDSDYLDLLVEPGYRLAATRSAINTVFEAFSSCAWEFEELPESATLLEGVAREAARWATRFLLTKGNPCFAIDLQAVKAGARFRKRLEQYRRRLEREADLEFDLANEESIGSTFASLVDLHRAIWNSRGEQGCFAQSGFLDFHQEVSRKFLRRGILRLYRMRVNGAPAAALYGFLWKARYYAYLQGYDERLSAYRAGSLLVDYGIQQAQSEGALIFDLMRGAEPYKRLWGAHETFNSILRLWPRSRLEVC